MSDITENGNSITKYFVLILMPLGIVLNLFSVYVFWRPSLNKTNMGLLNRIQLSIDTIILLSNIFLFRANILFDINFYLINSWTCKIFTFYR